MKYHVFNETDGILASPDAMTDLDAHRFIAAFRERFKQQGYYASVAGRIPVDQVEFSLVPISKREHIPFAPRKHKDDKRCTCLECCQKRAEENAKPKVKRVRGRLPGYKVPSTKDIFTGAGRVDLRYVMSAEQAQSDSDDPLAMPVICITRQTLFMRLPPSLQRECGGCECEYCKAHPELKPMLDTLAVRTDSPYAPELLGQKTRNHSWAIHMPDPQLFIRLTKHRPRL